MEVVMSFRKEKHLNHWNELEEIRVSCSLVPEVRLVPVEGTSIRECPAQSRFISIRSWGVPVFPGRRQEKDAATPWEVNSEKRHSQA